MAASIGPRSISEAAIVTMFSQPTALDCHLEPGATFLRAALDLIQKRSVDLLNVDAAVLHRFNGIGDLDQLAGGGVAKFPDHLTCRPCECDALGRVDTYRIPSSDRYDNHQTPHAGIVSGDKVGGVSRSRQQ